MRKKKDGPFKRNRTTAFVVFFIAVALDIWGVNAGVVYGFAGLFWIAWLFDKTDWLILEMGRIFADGLKSPEGRRKDNDRII